MDINVTVMYGNSEIRRVNIFVDGKPWYNEMYKVQNGAKITVPVYEHSLTVKIAAAPE